MLIQLIQDFVLMVADVVTPVIFSVNVTCKETSLNVSLFLFPVVTKKIKEC